MSGLSGIFGGGGGRVTETGQTTQYSGEQDDGALREGLVKAYTALTTGAYSGTTNVDLVHYTGTDISFDAASKELRATGKMGVFAAAGGETIVVTGSVSNNGVFTTVSATANLVVVAEAVTDEVAGATVAVAKREAKNNNCVLDLNTKLMWTKLASDKMGTAGTGLMPWTGQPYDIFAYAAAANAASLAGYADWRIPNLNEWGSLFVYQGTQPYVNTTYFTGTMNYFWISTTDPATSTSSLWAYPQWGAGVPYASSAKTAAASVLLVRG